MAVVGGPDLGSKADAYERCVLEMHQLGVGAVAAAYGKVYPYEAGESEDSFVARCVLSDKASLASGSAVFQQIHDEMILRPMGFISALNAYRTALMASPGSMIKSMSGEAIFLSESGYVLCAPVAEDGSPDMAAAVEHDLDLLGVDGVWAGMTLASMAADLYFPALLPMLPEPNDASMDMGGFR